MGMAVKRAPQTDDRSLARRKFADPAVWGEEDRVMFVEESDTEPLEFGPADNGPQQTRDLKG